MHGETGIPEPAPTGLSGGSAALWAWVFRRTPIESHTLQQFGESVAGMRVVVSVGLWARSDDREGRL
jgi:hypothetical protein